MVIIRCNTMLKGNTFLNIYNSIVEMASNGVILLPDFCELLNEVPPDAEIVVVKPKEV